MISVAGVLPAFEIQLSIPYLLINSSIVLIDVVDIVAFIAVSVYILGKLFVSDPIPSQSGSCSTCQIM